MTREQWFERRMNEEPSEIAVESCLHVCELAFIDGKWVITCRRRGFLAPSEIPNAV
jgi:hypothetical protein